MGDSVSGLPVSGVGAVWSGRSLVRVPGVALLGSEISKFSDFFHFSKSDPNGWKSMEKHPGWLLMRF